ncbi:acyl-CoA carboxylase epsilon subunit [Arsenicicoccus sp. oral taxon 190]|uniref:acyl-CoA carboxylase epsilon subunit n=1 Tax=Arsenicicoccus sp. oral taxon 190 TaxID=1658671 RepID=UPI00067A40A8|nr:acyl-CoA carboxylase epsilon subunit [Arsenicicoccus sp. oral taxon 190]AKT52404.1 hypothetical protein ADJ73_16040 [Arsenicicoccus sp. oral taxon 190]
MSETSTPADGIRPLLTVTKGDPTDEELAALLLVVAAAHASGDTDPDPEPHGIWASRARNLGVSSLGSRRRRAGAWGWRAAR